MALIIHVRSGCGVKSLSNTVNDTKNTGRSAIYVHWSVSSAVREGVGKSIARPTTRCHRTESIVSLERGVCS